MQVVITGSTKGLGLALAREFLQLGDSVVISSRSADHCRQAHQQLLQDKPKGTVLAEPCDVTQPEEVRSGSLTAALLCCPHMAGAALKLLSSTWQEPTAGNAEVWS